MAFGPIMVPRRKSVLYVSVKGVFIAYLPYVIECFQGILRYAPW